jgi:hypothetical protein
MKPTRVDIVKGQHDDGVFNFKVTLEDDDYLTVREIQLYVNVDNTPDEYIQTAVGKAMRAVEKESYQTEQTFVIKEFNNGRVAEWERL